MSNFFSVNTKDFAKGAVVAVLAGVLTTLSSMFNTAGFNVSMIDWGMVGQVAISAFAAYLGKNFFSDSSGKFGGKIG